MKIFYIFEPFTEGSLDRLPVYAMSLVGGRDEVHGHAPSPCTGSPNRQINVFTVAFGSDPFGLTQAHLTW